MSVEEVRSLVKQEKESEQELRKAKEEATAIVENAKVESKQILEEVEESRYYSALFETEAKKTARKKKALEKEFDDARERLEKTADKNMEKTVAYIMKLILEG